MSISSDLEGALGIAPHSLAYYQARAASSSVASSNPRSASPANSVGSMASSRTSWSSHASGSHQRHESPEEGQQQQQQQQQKAEKTRKKSKLLSTDRKKICVYHRDNPGLKQEEIAEIFGVERSTVSKILKEKDRWLNVRDDEKLEIAKWR